MNKSILLVVAVILLDIDDRLLVAKRPEGKQLAGLWEFPGGKVEEKETPEQALIRELKEELDIDVNEACLAPFTFASHSYDNFHLLMPVYLCRKWKGTVRAIEHSELKWIKANELGKCEMPPADVPLKAFIQDYLLN